MNTLTVNLGERSYPIHVGSGLLRRDDLVGAALAGGKVMIVSNETVAPLYLADLELALGRDAERVILPDGEHHKTLATLATIIDALVATRCGRDATVVALGGGVVGDIAGFAAACYQRGVRCVQVPTTLLAQVDSSVGGKTAVNHPGGKNLVGAFHQPAAVIADTDTLRTLSDRELTAGLAEVIKYGLIVDVGFFGWLEDNLEALLSRDPAALGHAVLVSCRTKATVVAADERERGQRALLNLGHTFGHAIEKVTGYGTWLHGEAVAAGFVMAAEMSVRHGWLASADVDRIVALLDAAGLPTSAPDVPAGALLDAMQLDKKVASGRVRLVLLEKIGAARLVDDYRDSDLEAVLRSRAA